MDTNEAIVYLNKLCDQDDQEFEEDIDWNGWYKWNEGDFRTKHLLLSGKPYLCLCEADIGEYDYCILVRRGHKWCDPDDNFHVGYTNVVAWRELPELPKWNGTETEKRMFRKERKHNV